MMVPLFGVMIPGVVVVAAATIVLFGEVDALTVNRGHQHYQTRIQQCNQQLHLIDTRKDGTFSSTSNFVGQQYQYGRIHSRQVSCSKLTPSSLRSRTLKTSLYESNSNSASDSAIPINGEVSNPHSDSEKHDDRSNLSKATQSSSAENTTTNNNNNQKKKEELLMMGDLMAGEDSIMSSSTSESMPSASTSASTSTAMSEEEHPFAPPMTYQKYVTMSSKRVPIQIRYTTNSGLRPYFLTVAKVLKETYPDVLVERVTVPYGGSGTTGPSSATVAGNIDADTIFEVIVDGRPVVRLNPGRRGGGAGSSNGSDGGGVNIFVKMEEVDQAIARARRRRRPSTVYGEDGGTNGRLEVLKSKAAAKQDNNRKDGR